MKKKVSWIIVSGGVVSGLGKGVAAASIGHLLTHKYRVTPIKCDGYLNVDPGTMNPIEHGEVFVLDDGAEVDMDFGHYERFLGVNCKRDWNLTMGRVYEEVRTKERRGDYLGKTVQLIPHVTDLIKSWWRSVAQEQDSDVMLVEIGGTVGDIENELYLEAARQLRDEEEQVLYVHLTYVPMLSNVNEQKTKPTQQSVSLLRSRGIQPDIILARAQSTLSDSIKQKIALFSGISPHKVITAQDVNNIYEIPLVFEQEGITQALKDFNLVAHSHKAYAKLIEQMNNAQETITVAVCGKYTSLEDSYASIIESIKHASAHNNVQTNILWIDTSDEQALKEGLADADAIIVPGGFGSRGVEGKIRAIQHCREHNKPFLGICYGLQLAVVEHARSLGLDAHTTEASPQTKEPVVTILKEQEAIQEKGGTMRLGAYPAKLQEKSIVAMLYGATEVSERHRHRYEVNPHYHEQLEREGLVFSGKSPDGLLVEFLERPAHQYFVATQAHPELKSTLERPAPLFLGLITAAKISKQKGQK